MARFRPTTSATSWANIEFAPRLPPRNPRVTYRFLPVMGSRPAYARSSQQSGSRLSRRLPFAVGRVYKSHLRKMGKGWDSGL